MPLEVLQKFDLATADLLSRPEVGVLGADEEQALLRELGECRKVLLSARPMAPRAAAEPADGDAEDGSEVQDLVRRLLQPPAGAAGGAPDPRLAGVAARYGEIRTRLALANLRLVAHVARKYRNRGVSPSDLLQEGFCGLLRSIDRFDASKRTRLASYAVWWIRQSLQKAVAACAYPVRLNPRHLRQLARAHPELSPTRKPGRKPALGDAPGTIRQILSATRPTISLNASLRADERTCLLDCLTAPEREEGTTAEAIEHLAALIEQLRPREQLVLRLRFGLDGKECRSLSEVSALLGVSKERIRQIQGRALEKLRMLAREQAACATAR